MVLDDKTMAYLTKWCHKCQCIYWLVLDNNSMAYFTKYYEQAKVAGLVLDVWSSYDI